MTVALKKKKTVFPASQAPDDTGKLPFKSSQEKDGSNLDKIKMRPDALRTGLQ